MKRIFMAVIFLALSALVLATPAFAQTVWNFGEGKQDVTKQGANGWYYLYSPKYNMGNAFDVASFKECEWNKNSTFAAYGKKTWGPVEPFGPEFVDDKKDRHNAWFLISKDGKICPAGNVTAAVKWVAPSAGNYELKLSVTGGNREPEKDVDNKDGVIYSVYHNSKRLFSRDSGLAETTDKFNQKLELKQGDAVYFICDPKARPYYDSSTWSVQITAAGGSTASTETPAPTESTASVGKTSKPTGSATTASGNNSSQTAAVTEPSDASVETDSSGDAAAVPESEAASAVSLSSDGEDSGNHGGLIALIVIGCLVVIAAGGGIGFYFWRKKKGIK